MTQRTSRDVLDFAEDAEDHLLDNPVRLRDIRSVLARVEAFAEGVILKRSVLGMISSTAGSGSPLPFPIRTSAGFLVIGLSGNIRIQTCPSLFIALVTATRAASICRLVIHPGSRAFKANDPKLIV